ncbi:modular polyketide synthase, partial [Streptomyces sp. M2CJ-2]|uniref:acyl carrier protein n=1 Tax=Streptomyces sp. M2CJ-2 TaxID=2803948 RepID=UPI001A3EC902
ALASGVPVVMPVRVDRQALRTRPDGIPAVLGALAPMGLVRATDDATEPHLTRRLAQLSGAERGRVVLEAVCERVALVLGHDGAEAVNPRHAFSDMGFDSLAGVELRNGLSALTGLRLPATLVFDYPSPRAVADYLVSRLGGEDSRVVEGTVNGGTVPAVAVDEDPVVIVGMGCRYPGGVGSPEDL